MNCMRIYVLLALLLGKLLENFLESARFPPMIAASSWAANIRRGLFLKSRTERKPLSQILWRRSKASWRSSDKEMLYLGFIIGSDINFRNLEGGKLGFKTICCEIILDLIQLSGSIISFEIYISFLKYLLLEIYSLFSHLMIIMVQKVWKWFCAVIWLWIEIL